MRWRQSRESQNVQDYRGRATGGGGGLKLGLGGIVLAVIAYFVGGPQLVMSLLSGAGSAPTTEEPVPAGSPNDEAGQFVADGKNFGFRHQVSTAKSFFWSCLSISFTCQGSPCLPSSSR